MTTITSPQHVVDTAVRNAIEDLERATAQLRVAQSPEFAHLVRVNPDANVYFSPRATEVIIEVLIRTTPDRDTDAYPVDISEAPDVLAAGEGYRIDVNETVTAIAGVPVKRRVAVEQPYTQEEKALLRATGKLAARVLSYDTLACAA